MTNALPEHPADQLDAFVLAQHPADCCVGHYGALASPPASSPPTSEKARIFLHSRRRSCKHCGRASAGPTSARPGFTFKPREQSAVVEAFIDALGLRDIRLLVQDWGGPIGLGFAERRPDLVHTRFICNNWAWPAQGIKHIENLAKFAGSGFARIMVMRFNAFQRFLVPTGMRRKLTRAERAAYVKPYPTPASRYPQALSPKR
jgi:pimeloyl-ACP methyl ester carboxylesterase